MSGPIRALGLQEMAMYQMFVTYYLIIVPITIPLTFFVGQHMDYVLKVIKDGMGIRGIYLGIAIGLVF